MPPTQIRINDNSFPGDDEQVNVDIHIYNAKVLTAYSHPSCDCRLLFFYVRKLFRCLVPDTFAKYFRLGSSTKATRTIQLNRNVEFTLERTCFLTMRAPANRTVTSGFCKFVIKSFCFCCFSTEHAQDFVDHQNYSRIKHGSDRLIRICRHKYRLRGDPFMFVRS